MGENGHREGVSLQKSKNILSRRKCVSVNGRTKVLEKTSGFPGCGLNKENRR